jgi:hypothetical protein
MIKHLTQMLRLLQAQERKNNTPAYEPPPFKPEKAKKNETHLEMLQRRNRDACRAGTAISANLMKPTPRPPRAPGQQRLRSNGLWSYWG